ncbi:MAG: DNA alkylation repair protein [Ruminococcus sp.]|nr:DNA alkylation repair protein [Ruminococcus sp.]
MTLAEITDKLLMMQDKTYAEFQGGLLPGISKETFIGVRTPDLKAFAKEVKADDATQFLNKLPHKYFDENQLHAFIICLEKDFDKCIVYVERFLPYVDNWATCDQLIPQCFKKNTDKLLPYAEKWVQSAHKFTQRFGIGAFMRYYLDDGFKEEHMKVISEIKSDEYYVNMMIAWYFATALAKQYDTAIKYIESRTLSPFTHKKAIRKAIESFRVTDEHKKYLKTLAKV